MDIEILRDTDTIEMMHDELSICIGGKEYRCTISAIEKISILTTDKGPAEDDAALSVAVDNHFFVLPSEHYLYEKFLFDGLAVKIPIDFQKIIDAAACTENAEFVLYSK